MIDKVCVTCGGVVIRENKYCSYCKSKVNTSDIGAVGELLVCADLLAKNYEVFRSVSPSSKVDLFAYKDSRPYRVQVKHKIKDYKPYYHNKVSITDFDILAAVVDGKITYYDSDFTKIDL